MKNLNVQAFKIGLESDKNAVLLDVRTPEEEAEGLIPNSVRLNLMNPDFPTKVLELDKAKKYYVYCRSGARSNTACQFMEKNGYTAYNLEGGIIAWNQSA